MANGVVFASLVIFLALVGEGCGGSTASKSPPPGAVNVAVVASFTGKYATTGQGLLDGAEIAAKNIDDAGGINGSKVNLIAVDTTGDPVDAVPAVRKMLATDNVKAVIGPTGLEYSTVLPILNSSDMVSFHIIGSPSIDQMVMPYSFALVPSDALLGAAMAEYAASKGYERWALVFDANVGAQTIVPSVQHAASLLHRNIVADPALPENAPSYEAAALQILNAKPDVILTQLDNGGAGTFFHELQTLGGGNIPVIGSQATGDPAWVQAVGQPYYNQKFVAVAPGSAISGPALQYLESTYTSMFHQATAPTRLLSLGWDGMTTIALAMVDAHSDDPTVFYKKILDVTTPAAHRDVVYTFADGAKVLRQGGKIKFTGLESDLDFNKYHRVAESYLVTTTNADGTFTQVSEVSAASLLPLS